MFVTIYKTCIKCLLLYEKVQTIICYFGSSSTKGEKARLQECILHLYFKLFLEQMKSHVPLDRISFGNFIDFTITNEGTTRGDTSRFDSFISHSVKYIEIVKSLKGFLPMALPSKVMAVLPNFGPTPSYLPKKSN